MSDTSYPSIHSFFSFNSILNLQQLKRCLKWANDADLSYYLQHAHRTVSTLKLQSFLYSLQPLTCSVLCILAVFVYSSVGSVLLSITASAWQKYCYLQIEWVALIFPLAWGKQQGTRGNVYLALCLDWDEQHLNKRSSICSVWIYLPAPLMVPDSLPNRPHWDF